MLSGGVGVLAGAEPRVVIDVALAIGAASAFIAQPYSVLLGILLVRATFVDNRFLYLVTLVGGALALVLAARTLPAKRVTVPFLLLLLIALPSVPFAPSADEGPKSAVLTLPGSGTAYLATPSGELIEWLTLASLLVVFCVAALVVRSAQRLRTLVAVILVSAVGPVSIGLYQLATGDTVRRAGVDAIEGPFDHPNHFAFYLLIVVTLGIVTLLESRRLSVVLGLGALVASASLCLFMTYTRSAWLAVVVVLAILTVLRYRWLWAVGLLALIAVVTALPSTTSQVERRFSALDRPSVASDDWGWRTGTWERMLPHGSERPLTGQGFGSYSRVTLREFGTDDPRYSTPVQSPGPVPRGTLGFAAHNDYVKMFVEMGIPGLLLWTGLLLTLLVSMFVARATPGVEPYGTAMVAVLVALIGVSTTDNVQVYSGAGTYALALCGGVVGVRARAAHRARFAQERAVRGTLL